MEKKKSGVMVILLSTVFVLVLAALVVFVALYLKSDKKVRELEAQNQELTEQSSKAEETLESVQAQVTQLQEEAKEREEQEQKDTEAEAQAEEAEKQEVALVANQIDMVNTAAGQPITEDQIDRTNLSQYFCIYEIPQDVVTRITGKSYYENDNIGLSDLRYLKMLHYNFNGEIQMGEMIVNQAIAQDIVEIFQGLFENQYQIEQMLLIDDFWAGDGASSDLKSIDHNNTSAFCYRNATDGSNLSKHAFGRAVDLNPQQNPYVTFSDGVPNWSHSNADGYIDRTSGAAHMITEEDLAYKLFTEHGFEWGGHWANPVDYQHFQKPQ